MTGEGLPTPGEQAIADLIEGGEEFEEPAALSDWRDGLLRNKEGAPKGNIANAILALDGADEFDLRFNELTLVAEIHAEPPWHVGSVFQSRAWTDNDDREAAAWLQNEHVPCTTNMVAEAAQAVAQRHPYHPVRENLSGLCWDGKHRLDGWLTTHLSAHDAPAEYLTEVGRRFLVAAVARAFEPGAKVDTVLILEGEQGIGKSSALRALFDPWFTDDLALLGTKDSSEQISGVWCVELAELDSMTRADVSKIKAFVSRAIDRFRPSYGRRVIQAPRQCVFVGTVNNSAYLRDETGGRRFWPVKCGAVDLDGLRRDRDQLFAEAVCAYQSGEKWWLDGAGLHALAALEQQARYVADPWDEPIDRFLDDPEAPRDFITISDLLKDGLGVPASRQDQPAANRVARCLRARGWERRQRRIAGKPSWGYIRPVTTGDEESQKSNDVTSVTSNQSRTHTRVSG